MFDFKTFPVIETERLILRDLRHTDAADVLTFRGDPIVQKYDDPVILRWSRVFRHEKGES